MTTLQEVLRRPLITEKTNYQHSKLHQYVFEVSPEATKTLVKDAVETLYDVKVVRVNIMNVPLKHGRNRRNWRPITRRISYKKAIVTLAPDQTIAVFEGVK